MDTDADVIVVGAGLAGLSAATRLQEAGRVPVVLEAAPHVGGRQHSVEVAGCSVEEGALFFGRNYPILWRHLETSGLDRELVPFDRAAPPLPLPGALPRKPSLLLRSGVSRRDGVRALFFLASLLPHVREIRESLGVPYRSRRMQRLDRMDAESYLTPRIGHTLVDLMASPFLESLSFAPARSWSASSALQVLAFALLRELFRVRGGNGRIAGSLAADLDVRLGARVVSLACDAWGARVEAEIGGAAETIRCRDVVLAVPAPAAAPLLPAPLAEAARRFPYSASIVIANVVRSLRLSLPRATGFGGAEGLRGMRAISIQQPEPEGPVLCFGTLCHPRHDALFDAPDEQLARTQLDLVEEANGEHLEVLGSRVIRWRHAIPISGPGTLAKRREVARLLRDVPHLALAGDWLLSPSQEGALASGLRAAERLLARSGSEAA
jgi:protoporphyrinogen/coproporphyrinogen III oxidase